MAGDPKEEWLRDVLGVAGETLDLLKTPGWPLEDQTADAEKPTDGGSDAPDKTAPKPDAQDAKTEGEQGNDLQTIGSYVISIPPGVTGKVPLVVIFAGDTGKEVVIKATPASYFTKAIVVFGDRNGKFAAAEKLFAPLLAKRKIEISATSICGYSSGGQAAFANYDQADKAVGLIDPNVKKKDFKKFDSKTIYSFYHPNPEAWPWSAGEKGYTIGQARIDAFDLVIKAGGFAEKTKQSHEGYPKYFLAKFESKLI
jgi:hypothetical protein